MDSLYTRLQQGQAKVLHGLHRDFLNTNIYYCNILYSNLMYTVPPYRSTANEHPLFTEYISHIQWPPVLYDLWHTNECYLTLQFWYIKEHFSQFTSTWFSPFFLCAGIWANGLCTTCTRYMYTILTRTFCSSNCVLKVTKCGSLCSITIKSTSGM
jgi:hypothetical protein